VEATRDLAQRLATILRPGDLLALEGELGAGKTEFARALLRALAGAEIEVPSPTFTLLQRYEFAQITVTHADLYRVRDPEEVAELGLDAALRHGAVLVEWPERAEGELPEERLVLRLEGPFAGRSLEYREVLIHGSEGWRARLAEAGL
jgi:tRNA threonylcarbamoyl adenosine modification protein YjeE